MNTANYTTAENIATFHFQQVQSFNKVSFARMNKAEQLAMFGCYLGKGRIMIDPTDETVTHVVKVCFGTDSAYTKQIKWDGTVIFDNN